MRVLTRVLVSLLVAPLLAVILPIMAVRAWRRTSAMETSKGHA